MPTAKETQLQSQCQPIKIDGSWKIERFTMNSNMEILTFAMTSIKICFPLSLTIFEMNENKIVIEVEPFY